MDHWPRSIFGFPIIRKGASPLFFWVHLNSDCIEVRTNHPLLKRCVDGTDMNACTFRLPAIHSPVTSASWLMEQLEPRSG